MPKNRSYVFDASAVIALLSAERGHETLEQLLPGARISAVNLAEVVAALGQRGLDLGKVTEHMEGLGFAVVPFDAPLAYRVGALRAPTRALGLSLGDRACLATAEQLQAIVVTADRVWSRLKLGIEIQVIR